MLKYLGQKNIAERIENALFSVFRDGKVLTVDLGGNATTEQFTDEICKNI